MRHEILPNAMPPLVAEFGLRFCFVFLFIASLSFLGLGAQPPTPSWGNMLNNAQAHLTTYPWLAIFPGVMIFLTIISVNYMGDGLSDALDLYKVLGKVE